VVGGIVVALGVKLWAAGLCFAFCGFVMGTVIQEFWRGARVRQSSTGTDLFTALIGLVGRNKRRYGGYTVHVGIVLIFLGFAGNGMKLEEKVNLKPGQQVTVGEFTARYDSLKVTEDDRKQMVTAQVTVFQNGKQVALMYPAKWFFRKHEKEPPTTEVAIRRGFAQDVYVVLNTFDASTQDIQLGMNVNPLVNWVWVGFGIMAIGIGIALLPEAAFSFALTHVPAGAVGAATTTSLLLLVFVLGPIDRARAEHRAADSPHAARTRARERDHVHVRRMPAARWHVRHDELPWPRVAALEAARPDREGAGSGRDSGRLREGLRRRGHPRAAARSRLQSLHLAVPVYRCRGRTRPGPLHDTPLGASRRTGRARRRAPGRFCGRSHARCAPRR
jgi:hypothetical protein